MPNHYSRKTRQLSNLVAELQATLKANGQLLTKHVLWLKAKIQRLAKELIEVIGGQKVQKIIGAAALMLGLAYSNDANAQYFQAPVVNGFGVDSSGVYLTDNSYADFDNDGDLDLIAGSLSGRFYYYENIGSVSNPNFAQPVIDPFNMDSLYYQAFVTTGDLDDDGDVDILAGTYYGVFAYYENTGTPTSPSFASPVFNPFGLDSTYYLNLPELADLDGDGDLDILSSSYYANFEYFENTGTATNPAFQAPIMNPFGLTQIFGTYASFPELGDLDLDGDLDLLATTYAGNVAYHENVGTNTNPMFSASQANPFNFIPLDSTYYFLPDLVDIDGDGDVDLIGFELYGAFAFYENTRWALGVTEEAKSGFKIYPNPSVDFISLDSPLELVSLEVYDLTGALVLAPTDFNEMISVKHLPQGAYVIRTIDVEGKLASQRFQKL